MQRTIRACPVLLLVLMLAACDSGDPTDEPRPRDVAGQYLFTEFTFSPSGTAFQPIVVLDTLVQSETSLQLSSGGTFFLAYQFIGGDVFFPAGTFEVTEQTVSLIGEEGFEEQFQQVLLDREFTLRRTEEEPDVLTAEISKTIDPSAFSDRYAGVTQMDGTLRLRLERQ